MGYQRLWNIVLSEDRKWDTGLPEHELEHVRQWYVCTAAVMLIGVLCILSAVLGLGPMAIAAAMHGCCTGGADAMVIGVSAAATLLLASLAVIATSVHGRLYQYRWYRGYCESRAFKRQLKYYPDDTPLQARSRFLTIAYILSSGYGLGITKDEAVELLAGY